VAKPTNVLAIGLHVELLKVGCEAQEGLRHISRAGSEKLHSQVDIMHNFRIAFFIVWRT
jgi:hypothetical protein